MNHEVTRPPAAPGRRPLAAYARDWRVLVGAALLLALLLALILWLALRGGGNSSKSAPRAPASAASIQRLNAFAASVGHPIYWAGPQPRFTYELSRTKDGRIYIRYLPPGAKVGNSNPNYLTVGTYPQKNAFATLRATAKTQSVGTIRIPGGGLAFQYKSRPTSVYLAYPGSSSQIEVFDPSASRALQLVTSGAIKPVGAPPRGAAKSTAASVGQLRALAVSLGHPLYWAGIRTGMTYELTRTRSGSVYVRYLPKGVPVGVQRPDYLTVGTYLQKNALQTLKATAAKNDVPTIRLDGGGVAFVDKKSPTSVYIAYPSAAVQVEVYDPSPGRARRLVTSGQIAPVR